MTATYTQRPNSRMPVLAAALALALAASTGAAAAADYPRTPAKRPAASASEPAGAAAEMRMSRLIGSAVRNPAGEKIGDVKDVVLDPDTGRVHYVVLSLGGFLGIGDRLFAMPLSQLRRDGRGRLVLDADKRELESAPGFDAAHWPSFNADEYRAQLDRRYGGQTASPNEKLRRASELLKAGVRDRNGAKIGKIEDMVVGLRDGQVHYVVAEFDKGWNPNDKLVALPMNALRDGSESRTGTRDIGTDASAGAAASPRERSGFLSFETPSGPSRGTASAVVPPGGLQTNPVERPGVQGSAAPQPIKPPPLPTTTSYADDQGLVFDGTREQLGKAPAFERSQWPDAAKQP